MGWDSLHFCGLVGIGINVSLLTILTSSHSVQTDRANPPTRAPTAGGQYHWAAMLAPVKFQKFLSYITGWFTIIGWQCGFAASAFITGTMIQGTAVLAHSKYDALPWQGTLIVWLALLVALLVNLAGGKLLPRLEAVVLVVHVLGFFGIMIPLVYMSDHAATHDVFLSFQNNGEFATQGLSWFVGMTSLGFAFAGGDAAVHVSVELLRSYSVVVADYL